jgi:hypothetical protein
MKPPQAHGNHSLNRLKLRVNFQLASHFSRNFPLFRDILSCILSRKQVSRHFLVAMSEVCEMDERGKLGLDRRRQATLLQI